MPEETKRSKPSLENVLEYMEKVKLSKALELEAESMAIFMFKEHGGGRFNYELPLEHVEGNKKFLKLELTDNHAIMDGERGLWSSHRMKAVSGTCTKLVNKPK